MTFAEQLRLILTALTNGPTGCAEVEWYPGDSGHYDDAPTPARLTMFEYGTHTPRIRVEHPEGLKALLEVTNTSEGRLDELKKGSGRPRCVIGRNGDELELRSVL